MDNSKPASLHRTLVSTLSFVKAPEASKEQILQENFPNMIGSVGKKRLSTEKNDENVIIKRQKSSSPVALKTCNPILSLNNKNDEHNGHQYSDTAMKRLKLSFVVSETALSAAPSSLCRSHDEPEISPVSTKTPKEEATQSYDQPLTYRDSGETNFFDNTLPISSSLLSAKFSHDDEDEDDDNDTENDNEEVDDNSDDQQHRFSSDLQYEKTQPLTRISHPVELCANEQTLYVSLQSTMPSLSAESSFNQSCESVFENTMPISFSPSSTSDFQEKAIISPSILSVVANKTMVEPEIIPIVEEIRKKIDAFKEKSSTIFSCSTKSPPLQFLSDDSPSSKEGSSDLQEEHAHVKRSDQLPLNPPLAFITYEKCEEADFSLLPPTPSSLHSFESPQMIKNTLATIGSAHRDDDHDPLFLSPPNLQQVTADVAARQDASHLERMAGVSILSSPLLSSCHFAWWNTCSLLPE